MIVSLTILNINNKTAKIGKILYVLVLISFIIFSILIYTTSFSLNIFYYLMVIFFIIWLLFIKHRSNVYIHKRTNNNYLDKIKQAKELLDNSAITNEEYEQIKKDIFISEKISTNNKNLENKKNSMKEKNIEQIELKSSFISKIKEIFNNPKKLVDITFFAIIISIFFNIIKDNIFITTDLKIIYLYNIERIIQSLLSCVWLGVNFECYLFCKDKI